MEKQTPRSPELTVIKVLGVLGLSLLSHFPVKAQKLIERTKNEICGCFIITTDPDLIGCFKTEQLRSTKECDEKVKKLEPNQKVSYVFCGKNQAELYEKKKAVIVQIIQKKYKFRHEGSTDL